MNRTRIAVIFRTIMLSLGMVSAVALVQAGPAHADPLDPSYTCDNTVRETSQAGAGVGDCEASGGAPETGSILGTFRIYPRFDGPELECYVGGIAFTPLTVYGNNCVILI